MFAGFGKAILGLIAGPFLEKLLDAYRAKLQAGNNSEKLAADLAGQELALEQKKRELANQIIIADEGRWWTALPRALVCYCGAIFVAKVVVWDTVLGLGTTAPLRGDVGEWMGWLMAMWFGGRTVEKVARIFRR